MQSCTHRAQGRGGLRAILSPERALSAHLLVPCLFTGASGLRGPLPSYEAKAALVNGAGAGLGAALALSGTGRGRWGLSKELGWGGELWAKRWQGWHWAQSWGGESGAWGGWPGAHPSPLQPHSRSPLSARGLQGHPSLCSAQTWPGSQMHTCARPVSWRWPWGRLCGLTGVTAGLGAKTFAGASRTSQRCRSIGAQLSWSPTQGRVQPDVRLTAQHEGCGAHCTGVTKGTDGRAPRAPPLGVSSAGWPFHVSGAHGWDVGGPSSRGHTFYLSPRALINGPTSEMGRWATSSENAWSPQKCE